LQCGVEKLVFTSTCGVIGPTDGAPLHEDHIRSTGFTMHYDQSKKEAEDRVLEYARSGHHAAIVSPSKVFGPGNTSHALTANAAIHGFLKKKVGVVPARGAYRICMAFIEDVVRGHVLAMEKGRSGERYILGGTNISYYHFFDRLRTLSRNHARILPVPKAVVKACAHLQEWNHRLTGAAVRFDAKSVNHLYSNYTFSSDKAIRELGYSITPLDDALEATIRFLNGTAQQRVLYQATSFENIPAA
jgi:nucleoside-diphosphate-sugar epimerase